MRAMSAARRPPRFRAVAATVLALVAAASLRPGREPDVRQTDPANMAAGRFTASKLPTRTQKQTRPARRKPRPKHGTIILAVPTLGYRAGGTPQRHERGSH